MIDSYLLIFWFREKSNWRPDTNAREVHTMGIAPSRNVYYVRFGCVCVTGESKQRRASRDSKELGLHSRQPRYPSESVMPK